jgi:hypothetical protein
MDVQHVNCIVLTEWQPTAVKIHEAIGDAVCIQYVHRSGRMRSPLSKVENNTSSRCNWGW